MWLTIAFWVSNFAINTLAALLAHRGDMVPVTLMRIALVIVGLALCFGLYTLLQRLPVQSFRRRAIAAAILAPITAELYAWLAYFGTLLIDPTFQAGSWSTAITYVASWTWFFLAWAGLTLALDYSFEMKEEQERCAELQALAHAAKLQALQNQVNPHFLFNSLNSMSALLMDQRVSAADGMITKLAGFLRMTLAADPFEDSSLEDELAMQTAYLEIEQVRYPDMAIEVDLPPRLRSARLPSLILQPIVENAVKHGVGRCQPPTAVAIRAAEHGGRLVIEVDNKCGTQDRSGPRPGMGLGLRNVRERLHHRFGPDARLEAKSHAPDGFRVRIEIPWVRS